MVPRTLRVGRVDKSPHKYRIRLTGQLAPSRHNGHVKSYRLNRLFNARSGRCFDVAIDHGFFGEGSFLQGIEDIEAAVRTVVAAGPDAVQLSPGQAGVLQSIPGRDKPALVLRTDIANVYGGNSPANLYSMLIEDPVGQALRLDAACVVVNLLQIPGRDDLAEQCLRNAVTLKAQCELFAMPLMIEPLVFRTSDDANGYVSDGDAAKIIPLVRQAAEIGADVIKADPTDEPRVYHEVVRAARVPVLVRGGGRTSDEIVLQRTYELLGQGARGIVYGRNVIQHERPEKITAALMALVHEGLTPEEAGRRHLGF